MKKIIVAVLCVIMSLVVFGCGPSNEEKYTTLKNEVNAEMKTINHLAPEQKHGYGNYLSVENIPAFEKFVVDAKPHREAVHKKLGEMETLSKKELKLSNDYTEFKKSVDKKLKGFKQNYDDKIPYLKKQKENNVSNVPKAHNPSDLSSKASKIFNE